MPQDESVIPVEEADDSETKEYWEPKLQEDDGKQKYVNNLCGKEILQLKGNFIPRGLVP